MNILKTFEKDFKKLPKQIQEQAIKKITLLENYQNYPSLRVKKIRGHENIWEGSITMAYRITFYIEKDTIYLRRIGTHSILGKP